MSVSQFFKKQGINSKIIIHYDVLEVPDGEKKIESAYDVLFKEIERIEKEQDGTKMLSNS